MRKKKSRSEEFWNEKPRLGWRVHIVSCRWVLMRWAVCAFIAASGLAYLLASLGPRIAIAG